MLPGEYAQRPFPRADVILEAFMAAPKKSYEAPRIVAREDLKKITLYTGFSQDPSAKSGSRDLFLHMP